MQLTDATYRLNDRTLRIRRTEQDNLTARGVEVRLDGGAWRRIYQLDARRTDADYQRAREVAAQVYGLNRATGGPACSNSQVHDLLDAMRDIGGC